LVCGAWLLLLEENTLQLQQHLAVPGRAVLVDRGVLTGSLCVCLFVCFSVCLCSYGKDSYYGKESYGTYGPPAPKPYKDSYGYDSYGPKESYGSYGPPSPK
jgi:hypothetical protein